MNAWHPGCTKAKIILPSCSKEQNRKDFVLKCIMTPMESDSDSQKPPENSKDGVQCEEATVQSEQSQPEASEPQNNPADEIEVKPEFTEAAEEDEPMPESLADFVVIDEFIDEGEELDDTQPVQWDCPAYRLAPRTYSAKDLNPTTPDPRCKPDWPLAAYWPVYLGNFRLYRKYDSDYNCTHAVQKYFASKGIPAFMVFRLKDEFFDNYQKRVGFYDMLVYFCCEKDANRATQWCNRELYYGHRLNVLNGRTPDFFSKLLSRKSWRFTHYKAEDKLDTESNIEHYLGRYGSVKCISKQDLDGVYVQFAQMKNNARMQEDHRLQAVQITKSVKKQRFVESDVEKQLLEEIKNNPKFMKLRLKNTILRQISHGVIPEMRRLWEYDEIEEEQFEAKRENRFIDRSVRDKRMNRIDYPRHPHGFSRDFKKPSFKYSGKNIVLSKKDRERIRNFKDEILQKYVDQRPEFRNRPFKKKEETLTQNKPKPPGKADGEKSTANIPGKDDSQKPKPKRIPPNRALARAKKREAAAAKTQE